MSNPLATYLHDHLAGSNYLTELLQTIRDKHPGEPLAAFASALLIEVEKDREVVQGLIDRVGRAPVDMKQAAAWLAEKVSQLKVRGDNGTGLGTFEALELVALGILGKLSLWQTLKVISEADDRLRGPDYEQLSARARAQHSQVEERRLQLARTVLVAAT